MNKSGVNGPTEIRNARHWAQMRNCTTFQLRGLEGMLKHTAGFMVVTNEEREGIKILVEQIQYFTDQFVSLESQEKSKQVCLGKGGR